MILQLLYYLSCAGTYVLNCTSFLDPSCCHRCGLIWNRLSSKCYRCRLIMVLLWASTGWGLFSFDNYRCSYPSLLEMRIFKRLYNLWNKEGSNSIVRVRRINLLQRDNDDEFDEVLSRRQSLNKYTEWQRVLEDSMEFQKVPPSSKRFHQVPQSSTEFQKIPWSSKRFHQLATGQEDLTIQGFSPLHHSVYYWGFASQIAPHRIHHRYCHVGMVCRSKLIYWRKQSSWRLDCTKAAWV